MVKRRVFYSFHFQFDSWRAGQVRNIGTIEGNEPTTDNDWEEVKRGGDNAIKQWIANQMHGRSCTVVLIGSQTANRKWINYEIIKSWNDGMGVVGINIHGLEDSSRETSPCGLNPFDYIDYGNTGLKLSSVVKRYDPQGIGSKAKYDWISTHLSNAVEESILIRNRS